jgi:hypothetical protein
MKDDFADMRAFLTTRLPEATVTSMDDDSLATLYGTHITLDLPDTINLPGLDNPLTTTVVGLPGAKGGVSIRIWDLLKHTVRPGAEIVVDSVLEFKPIGLAFSVLDLLNAINQRISILTKQQLAICRAVLLVMQDKKMKVLRERGASLDEIRGALTSQKDDVLDDLDYALAELVRLKALDIEKSGCETFYTVPW